MQSFTEHQGEIRKPSSVNNAKRKKQNGKTRDLFNGTFNAKMTTMKDKKGKDLTKAEGINKMCKNIQKKHTKKLLMIQITTMVWSFT